MIEIPVHNSSGQQVDTLQVDEQALGGTLRPALLKQAYVRTHANKRLGTAATKTRSRVEGSTRKLYRQKGTGNARRGDKKANILRGGGHAKAKTPHSWRKDMPAKMRRLANRNALLAKIVDADGKTLDNIEIKLVDSLSFDKPSTKQFRQLLTALNIDRSCLVAVSDTRGPEATSARNLDHVDVTQVDRLCAFDLLSHRYIIADKASLQAWIERAQAKTRPVDEQALAAAAKQVDEKQIAQEVESSPAPAASEETE